MKKLFTLAIVVREGEVLLARKLKKLGAGKWNGFGGKVEAGESIESAAKRECLEEIGVKPLSLHQAGVLVLHYPDKPLGADEHEVHVFTVTAWEGTVTATDEMAEPRWFNFKDIPYGEMWADDQYWLPLVLEGRKFQGEFWFTKEGAMVRQTITLAATGK